VQLSTNMRLLRATLRVAVAVGLVAIFDFPAQATGDRVPIVEFHRATAEVPIDRVSPNQFAERVSSFESISDTPLTPPPVDARRLGPLLTSETPARRAASPRDANLFKLPQIDSLATAGTGLAIVVGLFLLCMALVRRGGPKPTSPLPRDVVAVLGRVPLAARNFAQLLQIGNKLVLVAVSPEGVSPISEVTDPQEVGRILGLCQRGQKGSSAAEFQEVLERLAAEPAKGFLGGEATVSHQRRGQ